MSFTPDDYPDDAKEMRKRAFAGEAADRDRWGYLFALLEMILDQLDDVEGAVWKTDASDYMNRR